MEPDPEGHASDGAINMAFYLAGLVVLALIGWELWRTWDTATAPVYKLRKDQWACTQNREIHTLMLGGKFGNLHDSVTTICEQYTHSAGPRR